MEYYSIVVQLVAMALTLGSVYLAANRSLISPLLGLASFLPWTLLAIHADLHALHAFNMSVFLLHTRTYNRWKNEKEESSK